MKKTHIMRMMNKYLIMGYICIGLFCNIPMAAMAQVTCGSKNFWVDNSGNVCANSYNSRTGGTGVGVGAGGTGITSYAIGDMIYATATTTLSKLADVADGSVLRSGGVGVAPLFGKVRISGATTDISGILT